MKRIENYNKVMVNNTVKPVDFSLCKEVFEKFGKRTAKIMREKLHLDHEPNMNLMMVLFKQLYDQLLDFCSYTPAQRYF